MRQFVRFLVVGAANTVVSFATYRALLYLNVPYAAAAPAAFVAGAVNGYVFNRRWTFAARDTTRSRVVYSVVQVFGALATTLLVVVFVREVGIGKVSAYVAAAPPVTVCMFLANRLWTFREPDTP